MKLLYIDLFCGAGGTSTGVESARHNGEQCSKVIACVNHDANAIASHAANHPDALHFTEDIRTLELSPLTLHVEQIRTLHPDAFIVLWASLECTNFSRAKGGQSRDADSRTLAEHLLRYIEALKPDYIQIENVEEFMSWGDLDDNGKPISKDAGRCYWEWVGNVKECGYEYDYRILNSADFGAYTSRKRFFGIFAKVGLPITFPQPTHAKNSKISSKSILVNANQPKLMFDEYQNEKPLQTWKPVRDVLDFSDEGSSIFGRKKPLVEATLERIYAGLVKFVAGGKDAFLLKYNSMSQRRTYVAPSVDDPCPTVSTQGRLNVVKACFLSRYNSGSPTDKNIPIDQPCGVITTHNRFAPVQVHFLSKYYGGSAEGKSLSVEEPAGSITTIDHHSIVRADFLTKYYSGNPKNMVADVNEPSPTIRTKDGLSFISAYYGNGHNHSINEPSPTLTTKDRLAFVDMQYGNGTPSGINSPAATVTTNPKHQLVYCKQGGVIQVEPSDSQAMVKVKEFMNLYGIVDIKMRMLRIPELKQIMGFPKDYKLIGSQVDQKKFIGNAVEVNMARVLCEALCAKLIELNIKPLRTAA